MEKQDKINKQILTLLTKIQERNKLQMELFEIVDMRLSALEKTVAELKNMKRGF